jgi:hypothetical protein
MGPKGIDAFNRTVFEAAPRYIFSPQRVNDIGSWSK